MRIERGEVLVGMPKCFERIVTASNGVVSGYLIEGFNEANARCWSGIRDFLRAPK